MLNSFQGDLSSISSEIQTLQKQSVAMNIRLKNRQAVRGELSQFVDEMVVPQKLIRLGVKVTVSRENSYTTYLWRMWSWEGGTYRRIEIYHISSMKSFFLWKFFFIVKQGSFNFSGGVGGGRRQLDCSLSYIYSLNFSLIVSRSVLTVDGHL